MACEGKTAIINGVDVTRLFTRTGYSVSYNVVSGGNEGYLQTGAYKEDEIALKATVTFSVLPLSTADNAVLSNAVYRSDSPTLLYFDPMAQDYRTIQTKRGVLSPAQYRGRGADGKEYWTTGTLTFEEA